MRLATNPPLQMSDRVPDDGPHGQVQEGKYMPVVTELIHAFADLAEVFNCNPFGAVIVLLLAGLAVVGLRALAGAQRQ